MQFLALINMLGQTIYAYTMYAGLASLTGALTSLLGLSSLAPLARFLSMKVGGKNGGFKLPFRVLAMVASVLLALSLSIVTSVISHGIAWRFGTPVITSKELNPILQRLQTEWNRNKSATLGEAFALWTAPPQRSTNWAAFRELSNSPGARLSANLTNQSDVSLSKDGFIKVEHPSWAPSHAVPHRQMFILDLGLAFFAGLALTLFFGRIVSFLNLSSLNSFYAARLIRAYLGATNTARWKDAQSSINDVHPQDDLAWHKYEPHTHGGPLHLVNVTVNSTVSIETSMESKTCHGFNLCVGQAGLSFGHQHALWDVDEEGQRRSNSVLRPVLVQKSDSTLGKVARVEALSLGKWVSISGAAFTTGLGQVGGGSGTSFGTSLLCGLFNIRLGYWWENEISPSSSFSFNSQLPTQKYLFDELIGSFHVEKSRRWYLSDGGHLENTAAYELIRRRVPFIIVSDAGADPDGEMNDVANLVRRVRRISAPKLSFVPTLISPVVSIKSCLLLQCRSVFLPAVQFLHMAPSAHLRICVPT